MSASWRSHGEKEHKGHLAEWEIAKQSGLTFVGLKVPVVILTSKNHQKRLYHDVTRGRAKLAAASPASGASDQLARTTQVNINHFGNSQAVGYVVHSLIIKHLLHRLAWQKPRQARKIHDAMLIRGYGVALLESVPQISSLTIYISLFIPYRANSLYQAYHGRAMSSHTKSSAEISNR